MPISQTSLDAYRSIDLNASQRAVYRVMLKRTKWTRQEIAEQMGKSASDISGRVLELIEKGLAEETGERRIPPGKTKQAKVVRAIRSPSNS